MPKSTKKKKDKAADFTKAKLKLGKGKQAPSNAVDTSFKARSIALPTQSIAVDKDGDAPSTRRGLTFDALIAHLKHHNASTRKDAVHGLKELFEAHPELIVVHLTVLVNSCIRLISDEDASVRKILLTFLSCILRQVPREDLIPHSPVLLLFTTSAQTHIFPEIRIDAVRFIDLYLDCIPDVITNGWMHSGSGSHGRRVLEGYLGILNAGTTFGEGADSGPVHATSTASVVLSTTSKLIILKSLASFLTCAITSAWGTKQSLEFNASISTTPTWYFASSFATTSAFDAFDSLIRPATLPQNHLKSTLQARLWQEEIFQESEEFVGPFPLASTPCSTTWSLQDLADVDRAVSTGQGEEKSGMTVDAEVICAAQLARTLHSTLVSTFLDCAPAVFSPSSSPSETEMQLVLVVCRICRSLYGRIFVESETSHESARADLQTIFSYISPYFPFVVVGAPTARRDIKVEQGFQDLNLIFCELSSFLVLASHRIDSRQTSTQEKTSRRGRGAAPVSQARQIERVSAYIVQLLQGSVSGSQPSLPRTITPQAYIALLPTIWSLINNQSPDTSTSTFSALIEHGIKASSTSAVKRHTIDFIGRLMLLDREPEYLGTFRVGRSQQRDAKLEEWVLQLPKTLWELGSSHLATTETIARLLLRLTQRRSRLLTPATYTALRSRLLPYFAITHPTRGQLPGPYTKLPAGSPLRTLILDLLTTIVVQDSRVEDNMEEVVRDAVRDTPEAGYWARVRCRARE